jgi:hypothetical protein
MEKAIIISANPIIVAYRANIPSATFAPGEIRLPPKRASPMVKVL